MEYELEERQIVLCVVDKIVGTTVFVRIRDNGEGTITTSEIAPGRIRNLRDYVVPGKQIVCKVIKIQDNKIHLSLRRVKPNEKKELLNKLSKEKSYLAILKTILPDHQKIVQQITKDYSITDFFELVKENPKILEKYISERDAEKIINILKSKKEKPKEVKQFFNLSNKSSEGIKIIKRTILDSCKDSDCNIRYIAAGKYRISVTGNDFKKIQLAINNVLENIENSAKKQNCEFSIQKT